MEKARADRRVVHFTGVLEKSDNRLWGCHVRVPANIMEKIGETPRRVVRTLNGFEEHQCAIVPSGKGTFVLTINKQWREKLDLTIGARVRITLRRDNSRYGLPVSAELEELLRQDKEGNRLFHGLTPGRQRTLLYIATGVQEPEARLWRATVIVNHLKAHAGTIDYKQLYAALPGRNFSGRTRKPVSRSKK